MVEYVKPKILSENEHDNYIHLCGKKPLDGVDCSNCDREIQISCSREHILEEAIYLLSNTMKLEDKLKAYWDLMPQIVDDLIFIRRKNPFVI